MLGEKLLNFLAVFCVFAKHEEDDRFEIYYIHKEFECASFPKIPSTISFLFHAKIQREMFEKLWKEICQKRDPIF